jgi:hypothetical protein
MKQKIESMDSAFQILVRTGVMDPFIERDDGSVVSDGGDGVDDGPGTTDMRVEIAKRRARLLESELERMKDLMSIPFEGQNNNSENNTDNKKEEA